MLYREAGQFKRSYEADAAIFPIAQDRWAVIFFVAILFLGVPLVASEYIYQAILVPVLIYSIAALGLNILTGYCGQLSLGTGGFMAVGAVSCYKLTTAFPDMNLIVILLLSGLITAGVGVIFGIPSLRIKGFYLAVATLAAQFRPDEEEYVGEKADNKPDRKQKEGRIRITQIHAEQNKADADRRVDGEDHEMVQ